LVKAVLLLVLAAFAVLLPQAGLWAADSPASCPDTQSVQSISLTDWEAGLGAWTVDTYGVARPETFDTPDWAAAGSLPDGRAGTAAFVANLDLGDCGADDESGVLTLTSPSIQIPTGATGPRIAFNHWFDIEYGWDGGNLKISVNGGAFVLVPGSAFEAGPYTDVLFEAIRDFTPYNTNPLAEQEAFTGPELDPGSGSWTASSVNLAGIAGAGDSIRLRFDFGVDACFGTVGWYVDEVEVYSCAEDDPPSLPRLTLANQVIRDHGGTAAASAWTLAASGPTGFSGPGPSVSSGTNFQAGSYDLSATGGPAGYSTGTWTCSGGSQVDADTIVIEASDNATCTIIHDDIGPTLQLVKTIINDNGGVITNPDDFGLRIDGDPVSSGSRYTLSRGMHQASEDGLPGYAAGFWGGDCAPDGSITLALGQVASCTITNNDVDTSFEINAGHGGAWYNPDTSGQGLLIDVDPTSQFMFLAWFTYTDIQSDNPNEQRWLTAQGNYSGNQADLVLYETLGGRFDDSQPVNTEPVGNVSLVFNGCTDLQLSYSIDSEGLQGGIPLIRVIPGSEALCLQQPGVQTQAVDINAGMTGAWYEPATTGQGILVDARPGSPNGDFIFLAWFTYGETTASGQRWFTAQGTFEGSIADILLYETTGGSFDDPQPPTTVPVGSLFIDFDDCRNASLSYMFDEDGSQGEIALTKVIPDSEALCEELAQ
jgi:hypothetical protein